MRVQAAAYHRAMRTLGALLLLVTLLGCGELVGPHPSTYRLTTAIRNVWVVEDVYTLGNTVAIRLEAELWNFAEVPLEVAECGPPESPALVSQLVKQSQLAELSPADLMASCSEPAYRLLAPGQRRVDSVDLDGDHVVIVSPATEADPVVMVIVTRRGLLVSEPVLGLPAVVDATALATIQR